MGLTNNLYSSTTQRHDTIERCFFFFTEKEVNESVNYADYLVKDMKSRDAMSL